MKKLLSLVIQIDIIVLLIYITSLFIAALFDGLEPKYFDVVKEKYNSNLINVSQNYEGEVIEIKKVFYVDITNDNQIVALKHSSGQYIYVPSYLANYKVSVKALCYGSATVFMIFTIITLILVVGLARQRSNLNKEEVWKRK